jgi:hypothetical protein
MSKYTMIERFILITGLMAVIVCVYLKDNFAIPLLLISYFLFFDVEQIF